MATQPKPDLSVRLPSRRLKLWVFAIWYGVLALAVLAVTGMNLPRDYEFARWALATEGVVVRHACQNHSTVVYGYTADGQAHSGQDRPGAGCWTVGDREPIRVWYLPTSPASSQLEEPWARFSNDLTSALLAAAVMPAFILLVFVIRRRARRSKTS